MHTIPATIVYDPRTRRPLTGSVQVTDLEGTPISTYNTNGDPATPTANAWGHVDGFRVDDDHLVVMLTPHGGQPTARVAVEALTRAADLAAIVESGRLSEASLMSTFAAKATEPVVATAAGARVTISGHVVLYDSGWRDVSGLLSSGWSADTALMRRYGPHMLFRFEGITKGDGAGGTLIAISSGGWRAPSAQSYLTARTADGSMITVGWTQWGLQSAGLDTGSVIIDTAIAADPLPGSLIGNPH